MTRRRKQKHRQIHYCLLVNKSAGRYSAGAVEQLARKIKANDWNYSILEPETAMDMANQAMMACGRGPGRAKDIPGFMAKRGKVTGLVACGGDGTFNLVARAALAANIPIGTLPLGRDNNIARTLYRTTDIDEPILRILNRDYRQIDSAEVAGLPFFGSIGLGFIPEVARQLEERKAPRFSFGWGQIGTRAAEAVPPRHLDVKVDTFRFDIRPRLFNVNLLPFSVGLPLSPASKDDDEQMEVIFDVAEDAKDLTGYIKQIRKGKFLYGSTIRMYRGTRISLQPTQGQLLYLDGELVSLPTNVVDVQFAEKRLKVYC